MANSTQFRSALKKLLLAVFFVSGFSTSFSQPVSTYWKYVNPGPLGNHFFDIAYVDDNVGYACGDAGVIARTTDGGHSWIYNYTPTREALQSIQFVNETTGYAVGGNGRVVKTTNRGVTWDSVAVRPVTNLILNNLYFFDANNGIVVGNAGSSSATIYKTTNGGASWTSLASGFPVQTKNIQSISFINPQVGYVSGSGGLVAKTNDGGVTWTNISLVSGNPSQPPASGGIVYAQSYPGLAVVDAQTVIISSQNNSFIVKSTNGGLNWVIKAAQNLVGAPSVIPGSQQMWNMVVRGSTVAVTMGSYVGVSADRGDTWKISKPFPVTSPASLIQFYSADITPNNSVKLVGMYGIVADSTPGAPGWNTSYYKNINYNPIDVQNLFSVTHLDKNNVLIGGVNGTIYKSTDGGATWINKSIPEFMPPLYVPVTISDMKYTAADAAYMACGNGYVYRSLDGGLTWPDPYAFNTGRPNWGLDFIDANTGWVCASSGLAGSGAVFRTTNGGANWTVQSTPFTGANYLLAIDFVNNTTGWVVGGTTGKIFKTTDGGVNWSPQTAPASVTGLLYTVSFANTDTGYAAGAGGKVIRTFDGGTTWTDISPVGLLGVVNKIVFVNGKTGILFGMGGASFKTTDAGNTWTYFAAPSNDALANACVIAPYSTTNNPGGANVDMMVVGGRLFGGLSPVVYKVRVIDATASLAAPAIINISDKCPGAGTARGKILNPPAYTQIDVTVDGVPVLYYPNDSSFIYYVSGSTTPGSHTVRVRYTNAAGIVFSDVSYTYNSVNLVPLVSMTSSDADNIICEGQPVTFTAFPVNGGATPSYKWRVNGVNAGTNSTTFTYIPMNQDRVSVEMTSSYPCVTTPSVITYNPLIEVPNFNVEIRITAANVMSVVSPENGATYQWYKDGQAIAGATGLSYKTTQFGSYTAMETYHTCTRLSNAIAIAPRAGTGDDIIVYPVPATTTLYVQSGTLATTIRGAKIYDANGRVVLTQNFTNSNLIEINIAQLPAAVYFIRIETSATVLTKRFIKQ